MALTVEAATAEQVVSVTDAVLLRPGSADDKYVSDFCELPVGPVRNALVMAEQLQLIKSSADGFGPDGFLSKLLIAAEERQRASVFRLLVEQYPPFCTFRDRLTLNEALSVAAEKVRAVWGLGSHRETIKDTLVSFGSFSHALVSEGGGIYRVSEDDEQAPPYLTIAAEIASALERARLAVIQRLGDPAYDVLSKANALDDIVMGFHKLTSTADTRSPVMYAGNAIESLMVYIAKEKNIQLAGSTGILSRTNKVHSVAPFESKHKAMLDYLGHLRNAADHGVDPAFNKQWQISHSTAVEYVHVAISTARAIVSRFAGQYIV